MRKKCSAVRVNDRTTAYMDKLDNIANIGTAFSIHQYYKNERPEFILNNINA